MTEAEKQYNALLGSGELREMFPTYKGEWEKDKKAFTIHYDENQKILNDDIIELDDEESDYYDDY